jgi:hypothetical protein
VSKRRELELEENEKLKRDVAKLDRDEIDSKDSRPAS